MRAVHQLKRDRKCEMMKAVFEEIDVGVPLW